MVKLLGGCGQIIGGIYPPHPPPPGFGTSACALSSDPQLSKRKNNEPLIFSKNTQLFVEASKNFLSTPGFRTILIKSNLSLYSLYFVEACNEFKSSFI